MPPIVLVIPAQTGIPKKGGVSMTRGSPLRVARAGDSAASRPLRTGSSRSGHGVDEPAARQAGHIGETGNRLGLVQRAASAKSCGSAVSERPFRRSPRSARRK